MDLILDSLPKDVGFPFKDEIINHITYADDLLQLAEYPEQLQHLLVVSQHALDSVGLKININMSFYFIWTKNRRKKMVYDDRTHILLHNRQLNNIKITVPFTYLGAELTAVGLTKVDPAMLKNKLDVLLCSPTKPQQKLFMLRNYLLPTILTSS